MKLVAKTDIGSQRSENQDSYRGGRRPDDAVWGAVCDGMGGARGGRLASTMAVDALQQAIEAGIDEAHTPQAGRALLESAVEQANRSVYERRGARLRSAAWAPLLYARWCAEALRSMCMWEIPAFICSATTSCFSLQKTIPWCRRWWSRAR